MANICKRYVDAIYDGNKYLSSFERLAKLYGNVEFKEFIDNPMITNDEKMSVIKELIKQDDIFFNFISLILVEKRFCLINEIYSEYLKLYNEEKKILNITIFSAEDISAEQINKIKKKFEKIYDASLVNYEIVIDKSLLGGIKVNTGDKIYDCSLRTKLDNILS